ncbi:hypothetical protein [Dankookia sp. GCM10030260]|uniref:hypothetical protein n=1 Tax=Dankookia sp. GCM10030260 TaxID=3273390 RepID=UPI0036D2458C
MNHLDALWIGGGIRTDTRYADTVAFKLVNFLVIDSTECASLHAYALPRLLARRLALVGNKASGRERLPHAGFIQCADVAAHPDRTGHIGGPR